VDLFALAVTCPLWSAHFVVFGGQGDGSVFGLLWAVVTTVTDRKEQSQSTTLFPLGVILLGSVESFLFVCAF
jgi:hypothetical protein